MFMRLALFVEEILRDINVFYLLLKMRVKMVSVNMKSDSMNVIFVAHLFGSGFPVYLNLLFIGSI